MRRLTLILLGALSILGCDPVSDMEADIENLTSQTLIIDVVSATVELDATLQVAPDQTQRFQEGFDIGSTYLEPSFIGIDSIVVKNQAGEVLKVYKEDSPGKNIYNVRDWKSSEPSKRFFKYEFEILLEDLD